MLRPLSGLAWSRYLRRNTLPFDDYLGFRRLSPAQRRMDLARRLLKQIQYFGKRDDALAEWRDAARIQDPEELWKIWPSLPIISKRDLCSRFPADEMQSRFGLDGRIMSTGGSTGEPTRFFHDRRMIFACTTSDIYTRVQMGWKPGMPTVILWGSERDIGRAIPLKLRLMQKSLNEILLDGYTLGDTTVDRIEEAVSRYREVAIFGFTSMLEFAARKVLERGLQIPVGRVKVAWNGGEMLFPQQNELFRRAFGTSILNRYGGRELGAIACQLREDAPLEILRPGVFIEIVNEHGRPAQPGEVGRIVCTSTLCQGSPFLRYDVEDLATFQPGDADESGIVALSSLEGRISGILRLPDGREINCIYWNHLFKEFAEIEQFQVILRRNNVVSILLKGSRFSDPQRERMLQDILAGFLQGTPYEMTWVNEIPRTSRGKMVQVIREQGVDEGVFERPSR